MQWSKLYPFMGLKAEKTTDARLAKKKKEAKNHLVESFFLRLLPHSRSKDKFERAAKSRLAGKVSQWLFHFGR